MSWRTAGTAVFIAAAVTAGTGCGSGTTKAAWAKAATPVCGTRDDVVKAITPPDNLAAVKDAIGSITNALGKSEASLDKLSRPGGKDGAAAKAFAADTGKLRADLAAFSTKLTGNDWTGISQGVDASMADAGKADADAKAAGAPGCATLKPLLEDRVDKPTVDGVKGEFADAIDAGCVDENATFFSNWSKTAPGPDKVKALGDFLSKRVANLRGLVPPALVKAEYDSFLTQLEAAANQVRGIAGQLANMSEQQAVDAITKAFSQAQAMGQTYGLDACALATD